MLALFARRIAAVTLMLGAATAHAAWPSQPITFVVPYTPGTGIDIIARQLAARLPEALGQPVIVDNSAGASGNIGSEKVARAKPDGHTFLVQVNTLVMNRSLFTSLTYDPVEDFVPVAQTSWGTLLLVTNPQVRPEKDVAGLLAAARDKPGSLTYATPGVGTPHHLAMALFTQRTGADLLHVPYKGTAGAVTDLLGGRIDAMFLPVHVALPHIRSGRLAALATGGAERLDTLPEVPTLKEAGLDVDSVDMWYGVLAPKGIPDDVVQRMNEEIGRVLARPEVAAAFQAQGMVPATATPAEFGTLVRQDAERWAEVIRAGNITAE